MQMAASIALGCGGNPHLAICSPGAEPSRQSAAGGVYFWWRACGKPEDGKFADRHKAWLAVETETWEKTNGEVDRRCCLCLSRRITDAGHVASPASSPGRHDHASRLRMRTF